MVDLSKIPLAKPPPGVTSNFVNPPSLATPVIVVNVILLCLMVPVVVLRVYTRARIVRHVDWDDCKPASSLPSRWTAEVRDGVS